MLSDSFRAYCQNCKHHHYKIETVRFDLEFICEYDKGRPILMWGIHDGDKIWDIKEERFCPLYLEYLVGNTA